MTARSSWKAVERRICRALGGERTPLSGENSRHTSADCIQTPEYVEVKMQPDPTAHAHLAELQKKARRYDREPFILYEVPDGPAWAAMWLERYLKDRWPTGEIDLPHVYIRQVFGCALFRHEVGHRLPHRALVEDTIEKAREEGRPPLVVLQKKGSPRRVALVPVEVPA